MLSLIEVMHDIHTINLKIKQYIMLFTLMCTKQWALFITPKPFKFSMLFMSHVCKLEACTNYIFIFYGIRPEQLYSKSMGEVSYLNHEYCY